MKNIIKPGPKYKKIKYIVLDQTNNTCHIIPEKNNNSSKPYTQVVKIDTETHPQGTRQKQGFRYNRFCSGYKPRGSRLYRGFR